MALGNPSYLPNAATFTLRHLYFAASASPLLDHKAAHVVTHFALNAMKNFPNRFRPSSAMDTKSIMRERRKHGHTDNYNWQSCVEWYPAGYKLNRRTICKQFGRLHYLACHSPEPVAKKWQRAYNNFHARHFGAFRGASMRYLNKWSCHSWL